jgi:nucleotide-binding universal stress UspA family protein
MKCTQEKTMKILVPVDGSRYSQEAVRFIASRKSLLGRDPQISLVNVQFPIPPHAERVIGKDACNAYYKEEADKVLSPALAALKDAGVDAVRSLCVGRPSEKIAQMADEGGADLIVIGSHGHGSLAGLVLGSTAHETLARTRRPILLLRDTASGLRDPLQVGIAVDGSSYGLQAVRYVLQHPALFGDGAQFHLINAVPDFASAVMPDMAGLALPAFSAEEVRQMQDQAFDSALASVRPLLTGQPVPMQEKRLTGNAGDAIAEFAEHNLDVLVMGSHGYGAFKSAVLGSVARRIAARCKTPLLLIRDA